MLKSIGRKVMVGYLVLIIAMVLTGIISDISLSQISKQNRHFTSHTLPAFTLLQQTQDELAQLHNLSFALYGYTIDSDTYAERSEQLKSQLHDKLFQLGESHLFNTEALKTSLYDLFTAMDHLEAILSAADTDWDAARHALTLIENARNSSREVLSLISQQSAQQVFQATEEVNVTLGLMRWINYASVMLVVVVALLSYRYLYQKLVTPLLSITAALTSLSHDKNLEVVLPNASNDELGQVVNALKKLIKALTEDYTALNAMTSQLRSASITFIESAASSDKQAHHLSGLAVQLDKAIAEVGVQIAGASEDSKSVSESAASTAALVSQGKQKVAVSAAQIATLQREINESARQLSSLQNAGDQVGSVVKVIAEIAEQTNLLALNAAIEVASAGQHGRGFAVVADEVRTLASRTQQSTHQINTILAQIVESITTTVQGMEANLTLTTKAFEQANHTQNALKQSEQSVLSLSDDNQQLAASTRQVVVATQTIQSQVKGISQQSNELLQQSELTRAKAGELDELMTTLTQIATSYRFSST